MSISSAGALAGTISWIEEMAFERTQLASEHTMMACIRTSLSLIAFVFRIYQISRFVTGTRISGGHWPAPL
jgi:uncharacterized membrane protein YidH (DUF202 family)